MLIYNIFITTLLLLASVFASNKMTYYGCPEECDKQEDPSCGGEIDTDYFCALSTKIGSSYCNNYVVVMETKANAKKLVKAKIVDSCSSCPKYHVDLSKTAFTTLASASTGVSEIIWGIYSKSGELLKGPYYNSVSNVASSYGLSEDLFVAAFEVVAGKLASSGSNSGNFSATRGENITVKKTTTKISTTKTSTVSKQTKTSSQKVSTIKKTTTQSTIPTEASKDDVSSNTKTSSSYIDNNDDVSSNTKTSSSYIDNNDEVPVSEVISSKGNENNNENNEYDGATPDTIVYGNDVDMKAPKQNTEAYNNPIVVNSVDNNSEKEENKSHTGTTVGLITAVCGTCVGAGGVGLFLMKKKNPRKYDELKRKFPDAFGQVKRRTSSLGKNISRSLSRINKKSFSKKQYMPASTIEDNDEMARIAIYDNQVPMNYNTNVK